MGYAAKRDYQINRRLRKFLDENDKKPSALADKAGMRRDTFSAILSSRRPVYAEEVVPICKAAGCSIDYLLGLDSGQLGAELAELGRAQTATPGA